WRPVRVHRLPICQTVARQDPVVAHLRRSRHVVDGLGQGVKSCAVGHPAANAGRAATVAIEKVNQLLMTTYEFNYRGFHRRRKLLKVAGLVLVLLGLFTIIDMMGEIPEVPAPFRGFR